MDKGPSGTTETTTKTEPWAEQKPYLTAGFAKAKDLLNSSGPAYYPNSTVAGFTPEQETALTGQANRAASGSPLVDAAQGENLRTLNGEYLDAGNPHLQAMIDRTYQAIRPNFDAQFAGAGRYGSGAHQAAIGDAIAKAGTDLAYRDYTAERGNMQNAIGQAPGLANQDYLDIEKMLGAGTLRQGQEQAELGADVQRYNYGQNLESMKLGDYLKMVGGGYGSSSTQSQPYFTNPMAGILGLAGSLGSAALLGSDRRIKENIRQIGVANENGLPLYRFNYKGDTRVQTGVMAQDVEQVMPAAVVEIGGVKHVNYGMLFPREAA